MTRSFKKQNHLLMIFYIWLLSCQVNGLWSEKNAKTCLLIILFIIGILVGGGGSLKESNQERWFPPLGFLKFNVDGAASGKPCPSGIAV